MRIDRAENQGNVEREREREKLQTAISLYSDLRMQREEEEKWRHPSSLNRRTFFIFFFFQFFEKNKKNRFMFNWKV